MDIPSEVKILGHMFKVEFVDPELIDNDSGEQNGARNTIRLRNDLPQSQKEATFLHEIIHAVNINLEESEVEFLSQTLYCVLKENSLLK